MNSMTNLFLGLALAFTTLGAQAQDAIQIKEARIAQIQIQIDRLATEVKTMQESLFSGKRVFTEGSNQMIIASAITYNVARTAIAGLKANQDPIILGLEMVAAAAKTIVVAGGSIYLLDVGMLNYVIYQKNNEINRLTLNLQELKH